MKKAYILILSILPLFMLSTQVAYADQGSFANAGGSTSVTSFGVTISSTVGTPAGPLSIDCPKTSTGLCSGGTFSYVSTDGTLAVSASFTSGTFKETCYGGGRGRPVICSWAFTGYFSGTLTANGIAQAINGLTTQGFRTGGAAASGACARASPA